MRKIIFHEAVILNGLRNLRVRKNEVEKNELKNKRLEEYRENKIRQDNIKDADNQRRQNLNWFVKQQNKLANTKKAVSLAVYRQKKVNPNYGVQKPATETLSTSAAPVSLAASVQPTSKDPILFEDDERKLHISIAGRAPESSVDSSKAKGQINTATNAGIKAGNLAGNMNRANAIFFRNGEIGKYLRALVLKEDIFTDEKDLQFLKFLETSTIVKGCVNAIKAQCESMKFDNAKAFTLFNEFRSLFNEAKKQFEEKNR